MTAFMTVEPRALVTAAVSLADVTFVLAALTFLVAATTLYLARFRPGRIALHHIPTHLEWARGGGVNSVPDLCRVTLRIAASNPGAHPCVLERLVIDRVEVGGSPEFATGVAQGQITGSPGTHPLSALVDPGSSKQFELKFELRGLVSTTMHTTPTPDLSPLAEALGSLTRLDLVIRGDYQRATRRGTQERHAAVRVSLPAERARQSAVDFWRDQDRLDLVGRISPTA